MMNPIYLIQRIYKGRRTPMLLMSGFFVAFIWWIGPKLPFPFNNIVFRAFITAAILGGVGLFSRWRRKKDEKTTEDLMEAVAEPDDSDVLKAKFKSAVKTLKRSEGLGRRGLLSLPWYIIIGPPGSGKTTLLGNAGLNFPLSEDEDARAVRGVGGTRDCDWWFANEAVLLDTAGRYTTQNSDQQADRKSWLSFLDILKKGRKKRPINGIFVAIGIDTLLSSDADSIQEHAEIIRKRILELYSRLNGRFPVYLLITKVDLIAGFTEFFENLSASEREQVWGYTQQVIKVDGETANVQAIFDGEFELLLQRLSNRVLERVRTEIDPDRRALIVGFPEQLARARSRLRLLVSQGFMPNSYQDSLLLRGLYLTSGTQEGAPIDRMMSGVARALGTQQIQVRQSVQAGRSYFIKDMLAKVAFPEQDLLGLGYREGKRRQKIQLASYFAIAGIAGLSLVAWTYAFINERDYVVSAAERLEAYRADTPGYTDSKLEFDQRTRETVRRLDSLKAARDDIALADPKRPLVGLPGDTALIDSIDDAYYEQLQKSLGPLISASLRQRLRNRDGMVQQVKAFKVFEVNLLSTFVRAYASLEDPRRRLKTERARKDFINAVLFDLELRDSVFREELQDHIRAWVEQPRGLRPIRIDKDALEGAQTLLAAGGDGLGAVRAAYDDWLFDNLRETKAPGSVVPGIVDQVGLSAADVFQRRSGDPLNASIPAIFTRSGFDAFLDTSIDEILTAAKEEQWVYGKDTLSGQVALQAEARRALTERFVSDYIQFWRDFLNDVTMQQVDRDVVLRKMSRRPSPLKGVLNMVVGNTKLGDDKEDPQSGSGGINIGGIRLNNPNNVRPESERVEPLTPRKQVTQTFSAVARLYGTDEKPGEIDQIINDIRTLSNAAAADGRGSIGDVRGARSTLETAAKDLETAGLGFDLFFREVVGSADATRTAGVASRLNLKYQQEVLPVCREKLSQRYPFSRQQTREVGLRDLADVFGQNGVMTKFIEEDLGAMIDRSRGGWTWREDVGVLAQESSALREFQRSDSIRKGLFHQGDLETTFSATPVRLGEMMERGVFRSGGGAVDFYGQNTRTVRGLKWPDGDARLEMYPTNTEETVYAPRGDWGVFRILDRASEREVLPGGANMIVTFGGGQETLTIRIDTDSIDNPFTKFNDWRNFRCPAKLW